MGREGQGRADKSKESKHFKAASVRLSVPGKFYLQCPGSGVPAFSEGSSSSWEIGKISTKGLKL